MRRALSSLLLATTVAGCGSKTPEPPKVPLSQLQAAAPQAAAPQAAAPEAADLVTGTVLEHLSAPPYVYLRIKTAKGEVWAAVPEAKIETGASVTMNGMLMRKFESKTLKRTFDEIYFGELTQGGATASGAAAGPQAGMPKVGTPQSPAVDVGKVEKASGADAHTVSEVWARKASLEGKTVTVRGVVVKYNDAVMGKNWMHLQDGSGDAKQGTHDITVTSKDASAKGETVTIRGTVRTNRDFGAGYSYAVIIEDARVVKKS